MSKRSTGRLEGKEWQDLFTHSFNKYLLIMWEAKFKGWDPGQQNSAQDRLVELALQGLMKVHGQVTEGS